LQPGFILTRIDQKPIAPLLQKAVASRQPDAIKRLLLERQLLGRINGAPGTAVALTYLDGKNGAFTANVARQRVTREMSPAFGNFGPQPLDFEAKRLPSGFGYLRFNIWVMPMLEKMRTALKEMADAPGVIFDVRGNPGGVGGLASGISGHLFTTQTSLGKMQLRSGYQNLVAFPQPFVYRGALVVLTDHGSASTSEIFAAGLQDAGRAVVVGERTAGAALPSVIEKLPTGALFQYAIGDFKTPKGTLVEGRGVTPNVTALHTRASLLANRDMQLEAALAQLQQLQKQRGTATK
jgi:carboxyl-terminal processing protease